MLCSIAVGLPVGWLVAALLRTPRQFRGHVLAAVAFGNVSCALGLHQTGAPSAAACSAAVWAGDAVVRGVKRLLRKVQLRSCPPPL